MSIVKTELRRLCRGEIPEVGRVKVRAGVDGLWIFYRDPAAGAKVAVGLGLVLIGHVQLPDDENERRIKQAEIVRDVLAEVAELRAEVIAAASLRGDLHRDGEVTVVRGLDSITPVKP